MRNIKCSVSHCLFVFRRKRLDVPWGACNKGIFPGWVHRSELSSFNFSAWVLFFQHSQYQFCIFSQISATVVFRGNTCKVWCTFVFFKFCHLCVCRGELNQHFFLCFPAAFWNRKDKNRWSSILSKTRDLSRAGSCLTDKANEIKCELGGQAHQIVTCTRKTASPSEDTGDDYFRYVTVLCSPTRSLMYQRSTTLNANEPSVC